MLMCLRCGDPAGVVLGLELAASLAHVATAKDLVDRYEIDLYEETSCWHTLSFLKICRWMLTDVDSNGGKQICASCQPCDASSCQTPTLPFWTLLSSSRTPFWGRGSGKQG